MPPAAFPEDRPGRDAVDGDALAGDLARQRLDEADLRGLRRVVSGCATGLAAVHRRDDDDPTPAALDHLRKHELRHSCADDHVARERRLELTRTGVRPGGPGSRSEVVDQY